MHLKVFDKFSLGSLIEKRKKSKPAAEDGQAVEITEIKVRKNGKVNNTDKAAGQLKIPAPEAIVALASDVVPVRPHGPAAELTLEAEDLQAGDHVTLDEVGSDKLARLEEEAKIAGVSAQKAAASRAAPSATAAPQAAAPAAAATVTAAAPAAPEKEDKKEDNKEDADSLNKLFSTQEDEENPLASLINSLPDVSVRELMDDLAEIQRIIKEWRTNGKQ